MNNEEINQIKENTSEHSLAYELLKEVKASAKRWFIISIIEAFIILAIVGILVWYVSLPVESYKEEVGIDNDGDANNIIGIGDNYGK